MRVIMELEEPLQQGILLFPPQGMLGQLKKTWHKKFCQLFKASRYGIERLEIYDNQDEALSQQYTQRIITLEACVKISPTSQQNVFTVVTKTGTFYFGCSSESEMASWINSFQSVAFKDHSALLTVEEDNDLYCSSGEGVFSVQVVETEASVRCKLDPKMYTLIVAAADIKLMDGDAVIFTWPYRFIRRYGHRDGKFTFEAGRKCESGEGSFCLKHKNQQEIFRCISSRMKSMKKMLSGENSPSIECNDAQFHAALSMEAGSRSPLPPSPNNSSNLIDLDFSVSQNSSKPLLAASLINSGSTENSNSYVKPVAPIVKPKPAKPPRKYGFGSILESKKQLFENEVSDLSLACGKYRKLNSPSSPENENKTILITDDNKSRKNSYDFVEIRSDAWKTHGIDVVPHTERSKQMKIIKKNDNNGNLEENESQYEFMLALPLSNATKSKNNADEVLTPASSIIHNISSKLDPLDYDKLQHFGSMHKINHKPGYKMPNCSSSTSQSSQVTTPVTTPDSNLTWNNYDIVEDLSAVRLADDSHHGYGIIRKKNNNINNSSSSNTLSSTSSTVISNNTAPKYKVINDTEYAIVSKPKRV